MKEIFNGDNLTKLPLWACWKETVCNFNIRLSDKNRLGTKRSVVVVRIKFLQRIKWDRSKIFVNCVIRRRGTKGCTSTDTRLTQRGENFIAGNKVKKGLEYLPGKTSLWPKDEIELRLEGKDRWFEWLEIGDKKIEAIGQKPPKTPQIT